MRRVAMAWDVETTGLNIGDDRVIQFGYSYIDIDTGELLISDSHLFNPEMPIPRDAIAVHGISDAHVKNSLAMGDDMWRIGVHMTGAWAADRGWKIVALVAHNGESFDVPFLEADAKRCGFPDLTWEFPRYDTLLIGWAMFPGQSRALSSHCERYGVELLGAHDAAADAKATSLVFSRMVKDAGGIDVVLDFQRRATESVAKYGWEFYDGENGPIWCGRGADRGKPLTALTRRALRSALDREMTSAAVDAIKAEIARRDGGVQRSFGADDSGTDSLIDAEIAIITACLDRGINPCGTGVDFDDAGDTLARVGIRGGNKWARWRMTSIGRASPMGVWEVGDHDMSRQSTCGEAMNFVQ